MRNTAFEVFFWRRLYERSGVRSTADVSEDSNCKLQAKAVSQVDSRAYVLGRYY